MFSVIYGHLDTMFLSSFKVAGSIERLCLIFFTGLGSACSIMVGNRIGAGEEEHARGYARNFLTINFMISIVVSIALIILRGPISSIYDNLDAKERFYIAAILLVMACAMWAKSANIMFHMGIFRAGGDTVFSMLVDVGGVWLIGVPIAFVAGFVFHLPVYWIAACVTVEELTKVILGYIRYRSGRWMHNLVAHPATKEDVV
jgi:Na+-driven multidrug efflux pump